MSSVAPPDIWYRLQLPQEVADSTYLSALQLEAVIYACQQHEKLLPSGKRAGFLIGKSAVLVKKPLFISKPPDQFIIFCFQLMKDSATQGNPITSELFTVIHCSSNFYCQQ